MAVWPGEQTVLTGSQALVDWLSVRSICIFKDTKTNNKDKDKYKDKHKCKNKKHKNTKTHKVETDYNNKIRILFDKHF